MIAFWACTNTHLVYIWRYVSVLFYRFSTGTLSVSRVDDMHSEHPCELAFSCNKPSVSFAFGQLFCPTVEFMTSCKRNQHSVRVIERKKECICVPGLLLDLSEIMLLFVWKHPDSAQAFRAKQVHPTRGYLFVSCMRHQVAAESCLCAGRTGTALIALPHICNL